VAEDEEIDEMVGDKEDKRAGNGKGGGREVEREKGEEGGREEGEGSGHRDRLLSLRKLRAHFMYLFPGWSVIWREGGQISMYWRAAYTYRAPPIAPLALPSSDRPPPFPADEGTGTGKST